jgi:hypothetical protein
LRKLPESLPSIEAGQVKRIRTLAAEPEAEYYENERVANLRKNYVEQGDKGHGLNQIKAKQTLNRTRTFALT